MATPKGAAISVGAIIVAAVAGHIVIVSGYRGPWVYDDELGYQKLAQSIGTAGDLALFGKRGLSYSPLYPLVLSPLYVLHLSGVAAYHWTKIVNTFLLAVALIPIFKIARFVLPRGRAVVATLLSALAPLMLYSSLEMSESLAYPVGMFALWAMLVSLRRPSPRRDAVVIAACVLGAAVRIQFVVLLPAALLAVVVEAVANRALSRTALRRTIRALRAHLVLTVANVALVLLGLAAYAGTQVLSLTGRYANQRTLPIPGPWIMIKLVADHVAGLEFAVGVIPFTGALVAAYIWAGRRSRPEVSSFAAVALSVTVCLVAITALASYGQSYAKTGDVPRIHERYLFYVVPLFVIALLATTKFARSTRLLRAGLAAALVAGVLPLVIPYRSVVNNTIAVDTFGLAPFAAASRHGAVTAHHHAALLGLAYGLFLSLLYVLARPNVVLVVALVAGVFVWLSTVEYGLLRVAATYATANRLPDRRDWVDVAGPKGGVIVIESARRNVGLDFAVGGTAFYNLSVSHMLYPCTPLLSADFGEGRVQLGPGGVVFSGTAPLRARYVVAPIRAGIEAPVVATDAPGGIVLLEPGGGVLKVTPAARKAWACAPPRPG